MVEPVTVEDWELLQLDAAWLEGGGLLRQVSLVYPNQVVPLRLSNGSDLVRVRVLPGDPTLTTSEQQRVAARRRRDEEDAETKP